MLARMIPPSGPPETAVSASRHRRPVPRGSGGEVDFRHTTITDHKKLSTSGFLRCSSPNGPAPDLGTLRAMCHLLRSCWAETTPLNKGTPCTISSWRACRVYLETGMHVHVLYCIKVGLRELHDTPVIFVLKPQFFLAGRCPAPHQG